MRKILLLCLVLLSGQFARLDPLPTNPSSDNPIASARRIDWASYAGVSGGIPDRSAATVCYTDTGGLDTAATINAQIASCPAGQVVVLQAGTYNLTADIVMGTTNVTLRGQGANSTFLDFSGSSAESCGGLGVGICLFSSNFIQDPAGGTDFSRTWTPDSSPKGDTTITLSAVTGLSVGSTLYLNQLIDTWDTGGSADLWPEVWHCHKTNTCSVMGGTSTDRDQHQLVTVTAINGNVVTFTPGLYLDNWRSGNSPQAWYNTGTPAHGMGVEDLSVANGGGGGGGNFMFMGVYDAYLKGVRSVNPNNMHVKGYMAYRNTIAFSYFFGNSGVGENYGIDTYTSDSWLILSNIIQKDTSHFNCELGGVGNAWAYNYTINDAALGGTWGMGSAWTHGVACDYTLYEGNDGYGIVADNYHGAGNFHTAYRNRWEGFEPSPVEANRTPIKVQSFSRFMNMIGNVLGDNAFHTVYQKRMGVEAEDAANCELSIWSVGWGANCDNDGMAGDANTWASMFRWGNCDIVTGTSDTSSNDTTACQFLSADVPSGISGKYVQTVPSSQSLPASLLFTSKPAWVPTARPWPLIGPDVTSGDITNVGGHANKIPARVAAEAMGIAYSDATAKAFDRATRFPGS